MMAILTVRAMEGQASKGHESLRELWTNLTVSCHSAPFSRSHQQMFTPQFAATCCLMFENVRAKADKIFTWKQKPGNANRTLPNRYNKDDEDKPADWKEINDMLQAKWTDNTKGQKEHGGFPEPAVDVWNQHKAALATVLPHKTSTSEHKATKEVEEYFEKIRKEAERLHYKDSKKSPTNNQETTANRGPVDIDFDDDWE